MARTILYVNLTAGTSGAEFSLLNLLAKLDRRRWQPLLLLPESGPLAERAVALGVEVIILPGLIRLGEHFHFWKIPKILLAAWRVRGLIRRRRVALVHGNAPRAAYTAGLGARLAGVPCLVHVRDISASPFRRRWQGRLIALLADRILAVSEAVRRHVLERQPQLAPKVVVVANGIDAPVDAGARPPAVRAALGVPPAAPLVGAFGRVEHGKGFDVLLRAAALAAASLPDLRVAIVGPVFLDCDRGYERQLRELAAELGLGGRVDFLGFRSDVLEVMRAVDVVAHVPRVPDSLPRVLLEAAALGQAIVASEIGGIPEIVEHGVSGILVPPEDAARLASALLALLRDPAQAARLGQAARQCIVSRFSSERHCAAVTALYVELAGMAPGLDTDEASR